MAMNSVSSLSAGVSRLILNPNPRPKTLNPELETLPEPEAARRAQLEQKLREKPLGQQVKALRL